MSDHPSGRSADPPRLLASALLVAVVVAVLAPVLDAPLFMDDYAHLWAIETPSLGLARLGANTYGITALDDPTVRSLLPWWTSPDFHFDYHRPASTLLLALELRLWDRWSGGYHLTSLVAHGIAVLLVIRLAAGLGSRALAALAAGAVFGLHPGNLVAVYWVSNRSDVVALALSIAALLAYRAAGRGGRSARLLRGAALAALAAAILTKEIACLLPVVFALHDLLGLGARGGERPRSIGAVARRLARALPYLAISLAYLAWYRASGHGIRSGYAPSSLDGSLATQLVFAARSAVLAAVELTTGLPPSIHRHERLFTGASAPLAAAFVGAVVAAAALALRDGRRRPARLFALGWIAVFTAPTLGFLPSARYLYVASAGWAWLVGSIVDGWLEGAISSRRRRGLIVLAASLYAVALPALADRWLIGRFASELGRAFPGLVEEYTRVVGAPREGQRIVLLDTPSPATVSLIGAAFRFLHPGVDVDAAVLTSFATPPTVTAHDAHTVRIAAPPGERFFTQPVDWIYLTSRHFALGQRFRGAGFTATITALGDGLPTEVTFRFDRPLDDPSLVPICFDGPARTLRRCPFPRPSPGR